MGELVKYESEDQLPDTVAAHLKEESCENIKGIQPRLPKMAMPTGRGKEFSIERQAEETIETKEVIGIILYQTASNAYWKEAFGSGESVIPDCASHDGIKPSSQYPDLQSDKCAGCRHNRFRSARDPEGNVLPGKACRNVKRVVILRADDPTIPCLLTVPPGSLKAFDDFMILLTKKGRPYYTIATAFTIVTEKNKSGIAYPHLVFSIKGFINDKDQLVSLLEDRNTWMDMLKTHLFQADEVDDNPSKGTAFEPASTSATPAPEY